MDAFSDTTAAASTNSTPAALPAVPPPPLPKRPLSRRQENYARCVAAGMSYSEAFRQAGCVASTAGSMSHQIHDLNRHDGVRRRVAELKPKADQEAVSSVAERMAWLRLIITAKPEELSKVVRLPCDLCWTDITLAAAWAAYLSPPIPFSEWALMPDTAKPRAQCSHCMGAGITRVMVTPTDELSPEGRALFMGASQDKDGVVKIQMQDQSAAAEMLNKLQSAYVTRSLNLNANVAVHAARDATPEQALALFDAFGSPP